MCVIRLDYWKNLVGVILVCENLISLNKKYMATFEITEGSPGNGKSLYTARLTDRLVRRNKIWYKKALAGRVQALENWESYTSYDLLYSALYPVPRVVWSNIRFSYNFEKIAGYGTDESYLEYWIDTNQICKLYDVDLVWDEIATELDARNFANLSTELKRFLSQYRKRGVDIYANTQDFSMIDARARLMITSTRTLMKLIGSPDPSTSKPRIKTVWGIIVIRDVLNFREIAPEKKQYDMIPGIMLIERRLTDMYDTRQDIPLGKPAPLQHVEYECELGEKCRDHYGKPFKQIKHS